MKASSESGLCATLISRTWGITDEEAITIPERLLQFPAGFALPLLILLANFLERRRLGPGRKLIGAVPRAQVGPQKLVRSSHPSAHDRTGAAGASSATTSRPMPEYLLTPRR